MTPAFVQIDDDGAAVAAEKKQRRAMVAFWFLGLLNNTAYVVMNAGAKEITPSLVGLVYVCNVVPSFMVKLTLPYWQHRVGYKPRLIVATTMMTLSFIVVVLGQRAKAPGLQLFGVALGATQSGLGEASMLALSSFYDSRRALTAWSSGTGFAGIFGYAFVTFFVIFLDWSFNATLMVGLCLPISYICTFLFALEAPPTRASASSTRENNDAGVELQQQQQQQSTTAGRRPNGDFVQLDEEVESVPENRGADGNRDGNGNGNCSVDRYEEHDDNHSSINCEESTMMQITIIDTPASCKRSANMGTLPSTTKGRMIAVTKLWPYMVPLFLVYFAEYAMQSGTWAAIGFPVESQEARFKFYEFANWCYQAGVFLSRSSGLLFKAGRRLLWSMPIMQVVLLILFWTTAAWRYWYDWSLLVPCFMSGLLGGAVYVGAFTLIADEITDDSLREFALSAASIADSIGIIGSVVSGIFIQRQLYAMHGLQDA